MPCEIAIHPPSLTDLETNKPETSDEIQTPMGQSALSEKGKRSARLVVVFVAITSLVVGRFSVPDNEVSCVQDKLVEALGFANDFINTLGNEIYRDIFQSLCSLMVDITFITTFGFWVLRGTTGRLPMTLTIFYVTRALIQKVWYSPFPNGFYWDSPGIPSLVVPYGRGSDFFFSGHSGFMMICALEWHRLNFPKMRNFVGFAGVYTILILLIYRIHYSIDIFTGVFFAEWCFCKVDTNKDIIDECFGNAFRKLKSLLESKDDQIKLVTGDKTQLKVEEEC